MKKFNVMAVVVVCLVALTGMTLAGESNAKLSVAPYLGLGYSAFEDQEDAASSFPVGLQGFYKINDNFLVSAVMEYSAGKFEFEYDNGLTAKIKAKVSQNILGLNAHYVLPIPTLDPFIGAGLGLYTGKAESGGNDVDYKTAIGFNINTGVLYNLNSHMDVMGQFVYHFVSRKVKGSESRGMNNWAIHLGVRIHLF